MSSDTPSKRHHRQPRNTAHNTMASNSMHQPQIHHPMSQPIIANVETEYIVPSTPPRTPHKNDPSTMQTKSKSVPPESQHKAKNKSRPKNLNSPALSKNSRQHSPTKSAGLSSSTKPITTPSSAAYAGSTFHASPAPSALPIPSYYSKSVPESPAGRLLLRKREASNSGSNAVSDAENGPESRERTPLDFLFEADRQDKERARSASNNQQEGQATGPFQPPHSPSNTQTPPAGPSQGRPPNSHRHSGGLFPFEMDSPSNARSPIGPAFSTPYSERMKAARAANDQHVAQAAIGQPPSKAEDLKRYLFDGILPSQPSFGNPQQSLSPQQMVNIPHNQQDSHRNSNGNLNRRSQPYVSQTPRNNRYSGLRQEVTPTKTPNATPDRNIQISGSSYPSGQRWTPSRINYGVETGLPAYQGPLVPQSPDNMPNKHTREMSDLDNHLRSVLNLGPAKSS